jgi:hypothetical protein
MVDFPIDLDDERPRIDIRAHEPDIDDLRGRLDSIVPHFCAHPTCIQAFCPLHGMFMFCAPKVLVWSHLLIQYWIFFLSRQLRLEFPTMITQMAILVGASVFERSVTPLR